MIYADNAATTRITDGALEKMLPFLKEQFGNASSQYSLGAAAKRAIEDARQQVAEGIGAEPTEITFTSGGSEANTWAICSAAAHCSGRAHVITSSIEHPSVLNTCRALEKWELDVTYLAVDNYGLVDAEALRAAIGKNTVLASIMLANNEIGTIQPIAEIGRLLKERGILFHADAVQAAGHIPISVRDLNVDFLTASAHKFNGAKGTGILYRRRGLDLPPMIFGGGQEQGLRAGTENVAGIVAAGHALKESIADMAITTERLNTLVSATVAGIKNGIPNARVNGDDSPKLPGVINIGLDGASGEALMNLLDLKGICISTSSACKSGKDEPSHVLLALGQTVEQATSAIRISYGRYNTIEEAKTVAQAVCAAYSKIRASV